MMGPSSPASVRRNFSAARKQERRLHYRVPTLDDPRWSPTSAWQRTSHRPCTTCTKSPSRSLPTDVAVARVGAGSLCHSATYGVLACGSAQWRCHTAKTLKLSAPPVAAALAADRAMDVFAVQGPVADALESCHLVHVGCRADKERAHHEAAQTFRAAACRKSRRSRQALRCRLFQLRTDVGPT
jgi:hypothetical protein